jgi:hypothetical protein
MLGGAVLACAAPVLQPMVVESLHGDPARAPSAIADLFRDKPSLSELGIASAAAAPIDSASAAMALLAAYYGAPHTGATPGAPTSLEQIKQRLETDYDLATKTLDLRHGPLPRVATIVQLREGDFAIFTRPEGDRIDLYRPSTQTPERINPAELLRRSTGLAVLPVSRL